MGVKPQKDMHHGVKALSEESRYLVNMIILVTKQTANLSQKVDAALKAINILAADVNQFKQAGMVSGLVNITSKTQKIKDAIVSLGIKLDAEDVTNLDSDYQSSLESNLP